MRPPVSTRLAAKNEEIDYVVVGPGFLFQSGVSVYTYRLACALSEQHDTSVLLLQRLVPRWVYPGRARVGRALTDVEYSDDVPTIAQLDWYWGKGMLRALTRLRRVRPDVIVLQWWTAATLHSYLLLALVARRWHIGVIIEFHEVQDTGEAAVPLVSRYCRRLMPVLLSAASAAVVHNRHDLQLLRDAYGDAAMDRLPVEIAPHGPYDHLRGRTPSVDVSDEQGSDVRPVTELLFFGLIRPYKGLEDLIRAFGSLTVDQARHFHLTVVGETWENWTLPGELIAASPHLDRITFINRYVTDAVAQELFAAADALVLPYRRGSASGPMQIAMSAGINVVLYAVDGLAEAAAHYEGATLVTPDSVDGLREALLQLTLRRGQRFDYPGSWSTTVAALDRLVHRLRFPENSCLKGIRTESSRR